MRVEYSVFKVNKSFDGFKKALESSNRLRWSDVGIFEDDSIGSYEVEKSGDNYNLYQSFTDKRELIQALSMKDRFYRKIHYIQNQAGRFVLLIYAEFDNRKTYGDWEIFHCCSNS